MKFTRKMFNSPIFILGNPRSGTSLLRSLVNSHDEIVIPPECGFIHYLYPKYKNYTKNNLLEFIDDLFNSKKFEGWELNKEELLSFLISKEIYSYQELCYNVYLFYGNKLNKTIKYWGDKNNYYINYLDEILEIYPEAKFIHITRNPKDVFASYLKINDLPNTKYKPILPYVVDEFITSWYENNTNIFNFLYKVKNKSIQITYEDILFESDKTINKVFDFIGIESNFVLQNFNDNKFFDEPIITMFWKKKLIENIDTKNCGKFQKILSDDDVKHIDSFIKLKKIKFKYYKESNE